MITAVSRPDLLGCSPEEAARALADHFAARGQPAYRVRQVLAWLYERLAFSFVEMTDLPRAEREALAEAFSLSAPETAKSTKSRGRRREIMRKFRNKNGRKEAQNAQGLTSLFCASCAFLRQFHFRKAGRRGRGGGGG